MRNVSDKIIEKIETHLKLNNVFLKFVPFVRKCGNIWWIQTSQRAIYMPGNEGENTAIQS
jgi:hypothetical protein